VFRSSAPVLSSAFHDRTHELQRLTSSFESLARGAPRWLAILGPRKVGKTSLILEAARRAEGEVRVATIDALERAPLDLEIFRLLAARALDALLASEIGAAPSRRLHAPDELRAMLHEAPSLRSAPAALRKDLDRLGDEPASPGAVARWLDLPEDLARATGKKLVVAIDEVQELALLTRDRFDPFPVMRASWQRHAHVAYILSGSAPTMLRELVSAESSPFFQHFTLFELGPFARADAIALLVEEAPEDRPIPEQLAARIVDLVGGHPFYLQILGEVLTASPGPYDEGSVKALLQSVLFSRTGRLALYFEAHHSKLVGNATTIAATLEAVARLGPTRLTDVAKSIGASTASTARYLERLGDALVRDPDGRYRLADPLFARWVEWRSPGGTVVPMRVIGDEAELAVATHLAQLGFDLVYQSRGSRGAFDLLAVRGHQQLGVQVKRMALPLRFAKREWARMDADAARWGWRWTIAAVTPQGAVTFLDPAKATRGKELRLEARAAIENVLRWMDRPA
jgi:hypothetical protein